MQNRGERYLCGINAINLALPHNKIKKLYVEGTRRSKPDIAEVIEAASELGVQTSYVSAEEIENRTSVRKHQGICALAKEPPTLSDKEFEDLIKNAPDNSTVVLLDSITDPRNFGAILRTAEAIKCLAAVVEKRRSSPISDVVVQASTGASEILPTYKASNLKHAIDRLKKNGFWIMACSEKASKNLWNTDLTGKVAFVFGSEGSGIRNIIIEKCDNFISIPMTGSVPSLNVSVAAAVILYEKLRQDEANINN